MANGTNRHMFGFIHWLTEKRGESLTQGVMETSLQGADLTETPSAALMLKLCSTDS